MLTIGEAARLAGTTVRAVRHYHTIGLLPEPARDRSGYRRYDTASLLRLLRIRRMRELGLPLERITELVDAPRPDLHSALDALDAELAARAGRIAAQRVELARLRATSPDPALPDRLAEAFAAAAAAGLPARTLEQEKNLVLLDLALHPEQSASIVEDYVGLYARMIERPGYLDLAARIEALSDLPANDPEIDAVARLFLVVMREEPLGHRDGVSPLAGQVLGGWLDDLPPGQRRLMERIEELAGGG